MDIIEEKPKEKLDVNKIIKKFFKGFGAGYILPLIPSLIGFFIRRIGTLFTNKKVKDSFIKKFGNIIISVDSAKFGLSLGTISAAYPTLRHIFSQFTNNKSISTFLAGALSGLAINFDSTHHGKERRFILSLYLLTRGLETMYEIGVKKNIVRKIENLDAILFIVSCYEIMSSWVYYPKALPKSYNKWITSMAEIEPVFLKIVRLQKDGGWNIWKDSTDVAKEYCLSKGIDPKLANPIFGPVACNKVIHPGISCPQHTLDRLVSSFKLCFLMYFPVHLLPTLIFRVQKALDNPIEFLKITLQNTVQSSAFLSTFIVLIWGSVCFWRNALQADRLIGPLIGCALCGLSIFIEKKSRRMELALYCIPRALNSVFEKILDYYKCKESKDRLRRRVQLGTTLFSLGLGLISYSLESDHNVIGPSIKNVMLYFLE
eukprot:gene244-4490_t